ncbi:MAG: hypothetical protein ACKVJE_20370 [Pseudomonadales bacterium]
MTSIAIETMTLHGSSIRTTKEGGVLFFNMKDIKTAVGQSSEIEDDTSYGDMVAIHPFALEVLPLWEECAVFGKPDKGGLVIKHS